MFTAAELEAGWERVRENNGCAGVDAVTVERFGTSPQTRLLAAMDSGEYRPLPLLENVIEKAPRSTRKSVASWFTVGAAQEGGETSPGHHCRRLWSGEIVEPFIHGSYDQGRWCVYLHHRRGLDNGENTTLRGKRLKLGRLG